MLLLLSLFAYAGVVMDLVTANASGQETDRSRIYAQSKMIRVDEVSGDEVENTNFSRQRVSGRGTMLAIAGREAVSVKLTARFVFDVSGSWTRLGV
jgi:hypothetical protein